MWVVASFKLNKNLERAIADLESYGMNSNNILALPLDSIEDRNKNYDSYNKSLFETTPIFGTIIMLFGTIYGFVFEWGPILWGLIGLGVGSSIGILIDLARSKEKRKKEQEQSTEMFILIQCTQEQTDKVKEIIWKWLPLGITTYDNEKKRE